MTETPEFSEGIQPTPVEETRPKRGRPRPTEVVERDELVHQYVTDDGLTKDEIATQANLPGVRVYQSLVRLARSNRIVRVRDGGRHVWKLTS